MFTFCISSTPQTIVFMYSLNFYLSLEFFISSFISWYYVNALFIETNSSWLIIESTKALEIKTFILFNLDFANNIFSSCFFFFFLIINSYFLIPAVITQCFNSIAETVIPKGIPTKEAN